MTSEKIIELLKKNNMTQKDLAEKTGISKGAISYYISGARTPKYDHIKKIADALGTSPNYILGENNEATYENGKLYYIQRNLAKLDSAELEKAEAILKTVFGDIFNDEDN